MQNRGDFLAVLAVWLQVHVEVHVARGAKPSYSPSLLPNWDQDGRLSPGCSGVHFDCRRWTLEDFSTASPPPPHRSAHLLFQVQQGVLKKKENTQRRRDENQFMWEPHTRQRDGNSRIPTFFFFLYPTFRTHLKSSNKSRIIRRSQSGAAVRWPPLS